MNRFARNCGISVAALTVALSLGTMVSAQSRAAQTVERRARAAVVKPAAKDAVRTSRPEISAKSPADANPASAASIDLAGKRDPFVALVNTSKATNEHLPPGKAGLVIATLTVQGTVQGANGMVAVISNPDQRVYFVRDGDRLYDGVVEKISLDGVTFQENAKDAFGKPIERTVVKRIYPSAGEQQ